MNSPDDMGQAARDDDRRDANWMKLIRQDDESAFEALFRAYYEPLHDFVRRKIGRRDVAEGLVQNVFLNLWRRRKVLILRHPLRSYLYGAARNEAIKYIEHRKVVRRWERQQRLDRGAAQTPLDQINGRDLTAAVERLVESLPKRRRMVFVLSRYHGLSNNEVASLMGISVKTVEVQMWKALKYLRAHLSSFMSVAA